jgi:hypothetical protein
MAEMQVLQEQKPACFALFWAVYLIFTGFSTNGSGGRPCPHGASLGILPLVAYKAGVNTSGPRGAFLFREVGF